MIQRSLVLAFTVGLALMTNADSAAAQAADTEEEECAEYISSGGDSEPFFGSLLGTKKIISTVTYGGSLTPFPRIEGSVSGSKTTEYWVGTYRTAGGGSVEVNCSNYELT